MLTDSTTRQFHRFKCSPITLRNRIRKAFTRDKLLKADTFVKIGIGDDAMLNHIQEPNIFGLIKSKYYHCLHLALERYIWK